MARDRNERRSQQRDGSRFLSLPHVVITSPGWLAASHTARSLLVSIASQYNGGNNGRLVATGEALKPHGWNSHDTVTRALRELCACGLLIEVRKGRRPNKASWFALTWCGLDQRDDLDIDPRKFSRGAYLQPETTAARTSRSPRHGVTARPIAPPHGIGSAAPAPQDGAMPGTSSTSPIPPDGEFLEKPSAVAGGVPPSSPPEHLVFVVQ